jgi:hypothetical protein
VEASFPGERPTLGWSVLSWISVNLIVPDGPTDGDPLKFSREQAEFVLKLYEVDSLFNGPAVADRSMRNGRLIRRAVLSRPKGWGSRRWSGANTWEPTLDVARRGPVLDNYAIDPMDTFIAVPRGLVEAVTSSGMLPAGVLGDGPDRVVDRDQRRCEAGGDDPPEPRQGERLLGGDAERVRAGGSVWRGAARAT